VRSKRDNSRKGFTLIELLVVIAVIALMTGILMPTLGKAKQVAKSVLCRSNLQSLVMANAAYASENHDRMVLGASDIYSTNLERWHGVRNSVDETFDYRKSPLRSYMGDSSVKKCPEKVEFLQGDPAATDFEDGCGGYGYNMTYLGSRIWAGNWSSCDKPTRLTEVGMPGKTLMFADTAMAELDASGVPYYIEYSFAQAPFFLDNGRPEPAWGYASPSLHFRHNETVNVGWADGHVDSEIMTEFDQLNVYGVNSSDMMLGWFGVLNNDPFKIK